MNEGRIREGLTFDDVLLVPASSEVLPKDVSCRTELTREISLAIPLLSGVGERNFRSFIEEIDNFLFIGKPKGSQKERAQYPLLPVDFGVNQLFLLIDLKLEPGSAIGNNPRRVHTLFM